MMSLIPTFSNQIDFHDDTTDKSTLEQSSGQFGESHFRLINEIEEEEKAFARATTKFAIDAAKAETEKAMQRASMIETLCINLHDRLNRYVSVRSYSVARNAYHSWRTHVFGRGFAGQMNS